MGKIKSRIDDSINRDMSSGILIRFIDLFSGIEVRRKKKTDSKNHMHAYIYINTQKQADQRQTDNKPNNNNNNVVDEKSCFSTFRQI